MSLDTRQARFRIRCPFRSGGTQKPTLEPEICSERRVLFLPFLDAETQVHPSALGSGPDPSHNSGIPQPHPECFLRRMGNFSYASSRCSMSGMPDTPSHSISP